ncbi:uncharacterized protein LOC135501182 isoform X2 [Lineus longissimus]|uniref:uncharacterized protein LOC135501182 isoform X2 n=1 Tax=Lineus longissimus TaxID=88925 RepID=UPI002B4DB9A7
MDNLPALLSVITLSCFIYGVNLQTTGIGCPLNQEPARPIKAYNITLEDILNGDILMNKDPESLEFQCSETKRKTEFNGMVTILNNALDNCNYANTKPQLEAFNPAGFRDALQYMCKNLKVFKDNFDCYNSSQDALRKCRDEQVALADKENKTPLEKQCSTQRIHSFCADNELRSQCNDAIADYKKAIADHILSPQCGCQRKVVRMPTGEMLDECYVQNCLHDGMGYTTEVAATDGIVFGLKTAAMIEKTCVSTADGKGYKLPTDLKSCLSRDCGYRYKAYKLKLINQTGIEAAANYICENRNYMMGSEDSRKIIDELLPKAQACQVEKVKAEEERLDDNNKFNDMNEVVCSKHRITEQCIRNTFNCATCETIRNHLLKAWDMRLPSLCTKCHDVGYAPVLAASATSPNTRSAATIIVQSLFVLTAGVFVTLLKNF